jgi:hypothetical protein
MSVAILTGAGSAINVIPWGVESSYVQDKQIGDIIAVSGENSGISPGNTGALNLNGDLKNPHAWFAAMKNQNGCECVVSLDDQQTRMRPGIPNRVNAGWDYRIQNGYTLVTIPVLEKYERGSHAVNIVGFIQAELLATTGGGVPHFSGTFKILSAIFDGPGGGPSGGPFAQARVLVQ